MPRLDSSDRRFSLLALTMALGLFAFIAGYFAVENARALAADAARSRTESIALAAELRQSSDDLTRYAQLFVVTGNPVFEERYRAVSEIRDGLRPRPEHYRRVYWNFVDAGNPPSPGNVRSVPLLQLMREAGFTEREFDLLAKAKASSDRLILIETRAMNAVKGLFPDADGRYVVRGAPDFELGRKLMFGDDYFAHKAVIMGPINAFAMEADRRTESVVSAIEAANRVTYAGIFVLFGVSAVLNLAVAWWFRQTTRRDRASLEKSLRELGDARAELQRHRDHLEELVTARTMELQLANRQLSLARDAADQANRAKSAFLANMSHELRTPLNAILGFAQLLGRETPEGDPRKETLGIIHKSGEHLLALINDVLDLAKIESHRIRLAPTAFDLGDFVSELIVMLRQRAESKGLTLTLDQSSSFPRFVKTDPDKLRQCLVNVIGNAIKFTRTGGVAVKLTLLSGPAENNRWRLLFEVADTGPGIAPGDLDRIFRPFERLTEHAAVEGTGLGLAITREYVALLGGSITATSEPGRGSVFRFTIAAEPVGESEIVTLPLATPGEIVAIDGAAECPVLIVEDQPENRLLLRRLLAPYGFPLREAENGAEGVAAVREWAPRLVLLDRRMPVMDGMTAAREMRRLPGAAALRIIAVTAHAFEEERQEMLAAGCDDFLRKPFRESDLFAALERVAPIRIRRAAEAGPASSPAEPATEALRRALVALPEPDFAALESAVRAADADAAHDVLKRFPELEGRLKGHLSAFRFDVIGELLSGARGLRGAAMSADTPSGCA